MSDVRREDRIRQLAYELSEKAGFPPDAGQRFWLEAEQQHDANLNLWAGTPAELYASHMQRFYGRWAASESNGEHAYTNYEGGRSIGNFYLQEMNNEKALLDAVAALRRSDAWGLYDVSLLTANADLDQMTKRSLLMTDTSLLASDAEPTHRYMSFDEAEQMIALERAVWERDNAGLPARQRRPFVYHYDLDHNRHDYLSNFSGKQIDGWLTHLRPALEKGQMFLLPRTRCTQQVSGGHGFDHHNGPMFDAIVRQGRVKTFSSGSPEKQSFIKFLAEVPLPVVGDVPLEAFAEVYAHEMEAANALKLVLRERFLELDLAKGAQMPDTALKKVGVKLQREAQLAIGDIHRLSKKDVIQTAGVLLGTGVAILAAINTEMFSAVAHLVSGAGGLAAMYKVLDSHVDNRQKIVDNPYIFLWLIRKDR